MKMFCYHAYESGFWFRVFGVGLSFVSMYKPLSFSERHGHRKFIKVMSYRVTWLGVWK